MNTAELRDLSDTELEDQLDELQKELFNLRFQLVTGQLDNYKRLQHLRRDIARALTVQRQRELKEASTS